MFSFLTTMAVLAATLGHALAETHTVHFANKYVPRFSSEAILANLTISCGFGTVRLLSCSQFLLLRKSSTSLLDTRGDGSLHREVSATQSWESSNCYNHPETTRGTAPCLGLLRTCRPVSIFFFQIPLLLHSQRPKGVADSTARAALSSN
jgi:hypothetical protein